MSPDRFTHCVAVVHAGELACLEESYYYGEYSRRISAPEGFAGGLEGRPQNTEVGTVAVEHHEFSFLA